MPFALAIFVYVSEDSLQLTKLPEGFRWKVKDIAFFHVPIVVLQKRGWLLWSDVDSNSTLYRIYERGMSVEEAVIDAAESLWARYQRRQKIIKQTNKIAGVYGA